MTGEGNRQNLDDILAAALEYYGEQGQLDDTPLPLALERDRDPRLAASPLRFPGGWGGPGAACVCVVGGTVCVLCLLGAGGEVS